MLARKRVPRSSDSAADRSSGRTLAACALPTAAVALSWGALERPWRSNDLVLIALLALVPALVRPGVTRVLAAAVSLGLAVWLAFGAEPWELLPFRDEHVVAPLTTLVWTGVEDFYDVVLPFDPSQRPEMHDVMLVAVFGFVLAIAWLIAVRRPLAASAVTIAAVGWPATLVDEGAVVTGGLALGAALSIPLVLRARSVPMFATGAAIAGLVVVGAAWTASATSFTRDAVVDWQGWNVGGPAPRALGVRFVWDAQYEGISFPAAQTAVLSVSGPKSAQYWRASTLDSFIADRWFEDLSFVLARSTGGPLPLDELSPPGARSEDAWLEQRVAVKALVDDRLVAAGTPVSVEARSLGTLFAFAGGIVRSQRALTDGARYRIWSFVPDPTPADLAATTARYPKTIEPFLTLWGRSFPAFGSRRRDARVGSILDDPSYGELGAYRALYEQARQVTQGASSPYAAVLALESWFRQRGGFRYDEQPPLGDEPPLIHFVTTSRAGYCQHFAGAMAVMARLLGIPARVAVGFTSGRLEGGAWTVTDHDAHAWVEVWFPGHGWIPFDPTPGRGTFSSLYSVASNSAETVDALRRGSLSDVSGRGRGDLLDETALAAASGGDERPSIVTIAAAAALVVALAIGLTKWARRRLRYLTGDPRRAAGATRKELESFLRDQGVAIPTSATLDTLERVVADELGLDASPFAKAAGRARFGPPREAQPAARRARTELRTLLRGVRDELSLWARFRGFVSLRSLRGWQG